MARLTVLAAHLLLALCGPAFSTSTSCPVTSDDNCTPSPDCTGVSCQITDSLTMSANVTVQRCTDPALIDMQALGTFSNNMSQFNFEYQFRESGSVFQGGAAVYASVMRNWTSLVFSAYLQTDPLRYLIPEVVFSINTTECLCNSMVELAAAIYSPVDHDCSANTNCDGVTCALEAFGFTYQLDIIILSCRDPPAVDVVVADESGDRFYSEVFNESGTSTVIILGFPSPLSVDIVHHDYSMEVEANLTVILFGTINIVPRHTIILDPSTCTTPPSVTPTDPPSLSPPPPGAPILCTTLYDIVTATASPLTCLVSFSCTTLNCELVREGVFYEVDVRFFPAESDVKAYVTVSEPWTSAARWEVRTDSSTWGYAVEPQGSRLVFTVSVMDDSVTLQLDLQGADPAQTNTLIPPSSIPLPSAEDCLSWIPIVEQYPRCGYLTDCSGLTCLTNYGYIHTATVSVEKCVDPVRAELTLERGGDVLFQRNFTESEDVDEGYGVLVDMQRNNTHLQFSAVALDLYDDILDTLIPPITVPLEPSRCSCQSLQELADKIVSPVEHDCVTNEQCNGVRCELDVLGDIYHVETILLSCEEPPAVDVLIEDEQNQPLHAIIISRTGLYTININGLPLPLYVEIEHHDYSMDVVAYLVVPLIGNLTIIPPHKLILDRTTCPLPPTPPTDTTPTLIPPTFSPGPEASDTCQGLFDIARENTQEPFVCEVLADGSDCDTLECQLDILASSYTLTIEMFPQGGEYVASVTVLGDDGRSHTPVKDTQSFNVELAEGVLMFAFNGQGKALGMQVVVRVYNGLTETLINSTVPLKEEDKQELSQSSRLAVSISVPVAAVLLCVLALTLGVVVLAVWRWKSHARQFEFKPMTYSDLQARDGQTGKEAEAEGVSTATPTAASDIPHAVENSYQPVKPTLHTAALQTDV